MDDFLSAVTFKGISTSVNFLIKLCKELDFFLILFVIHRLWIIQDFVCSKKLVLRCESDEFSWDEFCSASEVCIFYSTYECPASSGLLTAVVADYLRRRFLWPSVGALTLQEAILARQNLTLTVTNPHDNIFVLYSILRSVESDEKGTKLYNGYKVDYATSTAETYHQAARSLGLLSLSLAGSPSQLQLETGSWVPDWSLPRNRFLLNHPKSRFSASPSPSSTELISSTARIDAVQTLGLQVDIVKEISSYLPPRRHCDHYRVSGANIIIFDEWFEFAKDQAQWTRKEQGNDTRILLQYAKTIQARGCNSVWEPSTPYDSGYLEKQTRHFLKFLEDDDIEETLDLQVFYAACFPSHDRRFAITERGHFCLVPRDTRRGDLVCIPRGNKVPLIFRKVHSGYQNLGESYVDGFMQGEVAALDINKETVFDVI